jgi:citrate lyase synthetase
MPGSLPSYFIQTKMAQRTNTRKKIFTNFIRQALDITQWHPFSETNYRCGKSL